MFTVATAERTSIKPTVIELERLVNAPLIFNVPANEDITLTGAILEWLPLMLEFIVIVPEPLVKSINRRLPANATVPLIITVPLTGPDIALVMPLVVTAMFRVRVPAPPSWIGLADPWGVYVAFIIAAPLVSPVVIIKLFAVAPCSSPFAFVQVKLQPFSTEKEPPTTMPPAPEALEIACTW
jgi:hypothetical protein